MNSMAEITEKEFNDIRTMVYRFAGIYLGDEKKSLVVSRLNKYLKKYNLRSYGKLLDMISKDNDLLSKVINSISTNVTYFFRESDHFDFIADTIVPRFAHSETIRIWSAGCSSGEEPYSVAICISEASRKQRSNANIKILATDISTDVIKAAQKGIYKIDALKNMSTDLINRYFDKKDKKTVQVKSFIRQLISFRYFNLRNNINLYNKFDLILCRNVMIYFDKSMQKHTLELFYNALKPGAYLFIGHAESIYNSGINFEFVKSAIYRKK